MQYALNASLQLSDGPPTLSVVNRLAPVPKFSVSHPNESSIRIETATMSITYRDQVKPGPNTCNTSNWSVGYDANGG